MLLTVPSCLLLLLALLAGAELMQAAPVELGMRVTRRAQWLATAIAIVVKLLLVSCGGAADVAAIMLD
jgi:hypothetical protein